MASLSSAGGKRKRSQEASLEEPAEIDKHCSFCGQVPASVSVLLPVRHRKKRAPTPYCLTCYYSTSAVRQDPSKHVSILDQSQLDDQLPPIQQLFSEVYVELQKELSEETEKQFREQKSDPLAMLGARRKPKVQPPISRKQKAGDAADGGFIRTIPLPGRLLKTQREQARLQKAQLAKMNRAMTNDSGRDSSINVYQRRKSSRKSIWNLAMDPNAAKAIEESSATAPQQHEPSCSCGSKDVRSVGNVTSRNQDMRKGETWGMKDRGDDVISRFHCNACGKTWNEEE